jgi:hypothetical protein
MQLWLVAFWDFFVRIETMTPRERPRAATSGLFCFVFVCLFVIDWKNRVCPPSDDTRPQGELFTSLFATYEQALLVSFRKQYWNLTYLAMGFLFHALKIGLTQKWLEVHVRWMSQCGFWSCCISPLTCSLNNHRTLPHPLVCGRHSFWTRFHEPKMSRDLALISSLDLYFPASLF